jgi:hypothetical protein
MTEVASINTMEYEQSAPPLRLPNASSAREAVSRWLLNEIGTAVYPGEIKFMPESFVWHVPAWLSYASRTQIGVIADLYLSAATSAFIGRPSREELIARAEALLQRE